MAVYQLAPGHATNLPPHMLLSRRWCLWQLTTSPGGRPTKRPDQSTTDLGACRSWSQVAHVELSRTAGIGYVTTGRQQFALADGTTAYQLLVDLDAVRDPITGDIADIAVRVIAALGTTYTEVSPSGTGLRCVVLVRELPALDSVRCIVPLPCAAPAGVEKRPNAQLFGLGPAGYVTMTGDRLVDTPHTAVIQDIDALLDLLEMREERTPYSALSASGVGPSMDEITERVTSDPMGRALTDGQWRPCVAHDRSASEAYHMLVLRAIEAAGGHGDAAVDWLLHHTAWGRGEIDESRDPARYTRERWVRAEVERCAKKRKPTVAEHVFDVLPALANAAVEAAKTATAAAATAVAAASLAVDVAAQWKREGPLVHLPTGIESLDLATGGGLVLGSRVYLIGAPDAGKTLIALQIIDTYLRDGITVGVLGVDEEPSDLMLRLLQRRGWSRETLEARSAEVVAAAAQLAADRRLMLFDASASIEAAAVALHERARELHPGVERPPCVLMIDSVQTAQASDDKDGESLYVTVTHRVRQIRAAASRYGMLVIATSEMSRAAYRSKKSEEQVSDMAAAKESGAIEFSARVLLAVRSVPEVSGVAELRIAKNKHGPSTPAKGDGIFLRIDRARQEVTEDKEFSANTQTEDEDVKTAREALMRDVTAVLMLLSKSGPMGVNKLADALGWGKGRVVEAKRYLLDTMPEAVSIERTKNRAELLRLDAEKLPPVVRVRMLDAMMNGQ